ncbi:MAG: hypothetical protein AAGH79_15280 [Bacteroidota bacterium]
MKFSNMGKAVNVEELVLEAQGDLILVHGNYKTLRFDFLVFGLLLSLSVILYVKNSPSELLTIVLILAGANLIRTLFHYFDYSRGKPNISIDKKKGIVYSYGDPFRKLSQLTFISVEQEVGKYLLILEFDDFEILEVHRTEYKGKLT